MLWILDGYNVIHAFPPFEKALEESLVKARTSLISMCEWLTNARGDFRKVIIVFDGKSEFAHLPPYQSECIKVVYSETGETADNRIIELLELGTHSKNCVVVSNDNYVRNHAKANAAKALNVQSFIDTYLAAKKRSISKSESRENYLPKHVADDITRTYRKHLGLD